MDTLHHIMQINFHHTGIKATHISVRSLRTGGSMAMFFGKIDMHNICLMGRWHNDAMMWYHHGQAQPIVGGFATRMYNDGAYTFQPDETAPIINSYGDQCPGVNIPPVTQHPPRHILQLHMGSIPGARRTN
jgi:hypothetical protein